MFIQLEELCLTDCLPRPQQEVDVCRCSHDDFITSLACGAEHLSIKRGVGRMPSQSCMRQDLVAPFMSMPAFSEHSSSLPHVCSEEVPFSRMAGSLLCALANEHWSCWVSGEFNRGKAWCAERHAGPYLALPRTGVPHGGPLEGHLSWDIAAITPGKARHLCCVCVLYVCRSQL